MGLIGWKQYLSLAFHLSKHPAEGKNRVTLVDELMDLVDEFSVLLILLYSVFFKLSQKYPRSPFWSKSNHQEDWQWDVWLFLPQKTQPVLPAEITELSSWRQLPGFKGEGGDISDGVGVWFEE